MTAMTAMTTTMASTPAPTLGLRPLPTPPVSTRVRHPGQWALPLDPVDDARAGAATPTFAAVREGAAETAGEHRARRFVQALLEVAGGVRPVHQLARSMAPRVYDDFAARLARVARTRRAAGTAVRCPVPPTHVATVRVCEPVEHVQEIAARFVQNGRSRAIAVRLELRTDHRGTPRWVCTALAWG